MTSTLPRRAAPTNQDISDADLIQRVARARDRDAFRLLFTRYGSKLKAYMIRVGASPDQAEEAAQEALVALWRRAETFDPRRASAQAWIFAIARNKRVDLFRRWSRPEPDPSDPTYHPDPPPPLESWVDAERLGLMIRTTLSKLPDEQKAIVVLSFFEEYTHLEISAKLKIPLGTVKSRLRLAMKKLKILSSDYI